MTVGERVKSIPEMYTSVPLSIVAECPSLHTVWMRSCPFCNNPLPNRLFDLLQCGRHNGKSYVQLGEWVDEQLRRLNAVSSGSAASGDGIGVREAPGKLATQDGGEE